MSEVPKLKPCPFCGAEIEAFIFRSKVNPNYWANEHWFLRDNHDEKCFLHLIRVLPAFLQIKPLIRTPTNRCDISGIKNEIRFFTSNTINRLVAW